MSSIAFQYGLLGTLAILMLVAVYTDIRTRTISNWLILAIAVGAPLFWIASGLPLWPGVAIQIGLFLGVFVVLAGFNALGLMGGGDVKILAALALWFDPLQFLRLFVIMSLLGGVLTIVLYCWNVAWRKRGKPIIPYGVAISAATLWVLGVTYLPALSLGAENMG